MTPVRRALLRRLVDAIEALPSDRPRRVAIDGVDGAGKTVLADELTELVGSGRPVLRAGVDGFHRPRAQRYARDRRSPTGYYLDSYDYPTLRSVLLDPLDAGGPVCPAVWDHTRDAPVPRQWLPVETSTVLVCSTASSCTDRSCATSGICRSSAASGPRSRAPGWRNATARRPIPDIRRTVGTSRDNAATSPPATLNRATYVVDNTDLAAPYVVER